jgi:cytochrome c-type biogenesis protein CcmH/NrfF
VPEKTHRRGGGTHLTLGAPSIMDNENLVQPPAAGVLITIRQGNKNARVVSITTLAYTMDVLLHGSLSNLDHAVVWGGPLGALIGGCIVVWGPAATPAGKAERRFKP